MWNKDKNYSRILCMQAGREWIEILSVEKKNRIQYAPNLTFKNKGDLMVLSDK